MKMKHKRLVKRIVAGIFALLMVYGSSFGNPFVFPFAIGFVLVQYLSWRLSDAPDSITSRSLALDYSVIAIIVISAITVFLSKPIIAFFIFVFGIAGVVLSYKLTKVKTKTKKNKVKNFIL